MSIDKLGYFTQVSISGQAVVFVVRTIQWSPLAVAGRLTYIAFVLAQVSASLLPLLNALWCFAMQCQQHCVSCVSGWW